MAIRFYTTDDQNVALQGLNIKSLPLKPLKTKQWMCSIAQRYQSEILDLNVIFCTDKELLKINIDFLSHDYFTDIITFNYSEGNKIHGELYISVDTVIGNSKVYNVSFYRELYRVIIHGLLHLCGEDDQTSLMSESMRNAEDEAIERLSSFNIMLA
mgnify:CR=1 FL=1